MSGPYFQNDGGDCGIGYLPPPSPDGIGGPDGECETAYAIRPVNIAQILAATQGNSEEAGFLLDGVPLTMATIVAQVVSVRTQTTADVFKLQDSSGEIDARQWATRDVSIDDSVYQDKFVRFTGFIRAFQNRRHINVQITSVLEDQNEAYFHFNEVMMVTLYHRYGILKDRQGSGSVTYGNGSVSNYHQLATSYVNNEQFECPPPIQRPVLEDMVALGKGLGRLTIEPTDVAEAIEKPSDRN